MTLPSFEAELRTTLLRRRAEALVEYERHIVAGDAVPAGETGRVQLAPAEQAQATAAAAEAEYFERLPCLMLSCCPVCDEALERRLDPYGFDGPFWRADAAPQEPLPCAHLCALVGAVDLAGQAVVGGGFAAHLGPGAPYAIPRLLEHPGMVLVVSRLPLANGCVAYPLAYFAPERLPPEDRTAGWARSEHVYDTTQGRRAWRVPADAWDFDLEQYVARGQLRWCAPGGDRRSLASDGPCPYVGLPGPRAPQIVRGKRVQLAPVPDGRPIIPPWR